MKGIMKMAEKKQIKTKKRVMDHGEVFTSEREVNAMLDLVKQETERIESRFLEPACGDGNFLAEVIHRKLEVVRRKYDKSRADYERYAVLALSSIYGVDILEDNVKECRERLFGIWDARYTKIYNGDCDDHCRQTARYILSCNILCGDALTMKKNDGTPIIFAQWDFVMGTQIKRKDYRLDELMEGHEEQISFNMVSGNWEYDTETDSMVPKPVKEYPMMDFRRIGNE